jgi:TRAP transporter TAXI family solute receptor
MLWPDVMHVVVRAPLAASGNVSDLAALGEAPISIGQQHSGTRASATTVLTNMGLDPLGMKLVEAGSYDGMVTAFEAGEIDAMIMSGGLPISALARLTATAGGEPRLLRFDEAQVFAANGPLNGVWTAYVIPGGTYPSLSDDVTTLAEANGLIVRGDVPDDDVYALVKAIFDHGAFLERMHPAAASIRLETAFDGMTFPLHPGALRYFEEMGIAVPDGLRPPGS